MLLTNEIEVIWKLANKRLFIDKYNFTKYGDSFSVKIEDLPKSAAYTIPVLCDYCLEEGIETVLNVKYINYLKSMKTISHKISCKKCHAKKVSECKTQYTYETMVELFQEKNFKVLLPKEKYKTARTLVNYECLVCGHKSRMSLSHLLLGRKCKVCSIEEKADNQRYTYKEVYDYFKEQGCELLSTEYHNKDELLDYKCSCGNISKTRFGAFKKGHRCWKCGLIKKRKNLFQNNSAPCSMQQRYLYGLLGGELNYPIKYYSLDIAFSEYKIYIEYDGSGHDLQVKFGNITPKQFLKKESNRQSYLQKKGWKEIRIISKKDYFPENEEVLVDEINTAKAFLLSNYNNNYYEIVFDNTNPNVKFGKLHRFRNDNCSKFKSFYEEVI